MGLGLHLSKQIVQKHAGRLWWEPDVPEGTRFVVELQIDGPECGVNVAFISLTMKQKCGMR